jgi:hypothetical protein
MAASPDRSLDVAYIQAMIDWTKDDVGRMHYRVTASLGIVVLFITQLPFARLAKYEPRWLLFAGLILMLVAALSHAKYLAFVHRSRRRLAGCLRHGDVELAGSVWEDVWRRQGRFLHVGDALLIAGVVVLGVVFAGLLG